MADDEKKAKLKEQLNVAHTLRNSIRNLSSPRKEDVEKIKSVAEECLALATSINMEHGKALSLELLSFAKMIELDSIYHTDAETIRTDDQKEVMKRKYLELEPDLMEAQKLAINYGDVHLVTRVLELLANIYRRADAYEQEVATIERALKVSRTTPKVLALLDALTRMIDFMFEKHPEHADAILKYHTHYWENYLWLKEQPGFDRDKFILSRRIHFYKVAIYIGSIAGNPLNLGEQNPENFKIAGEAYDEAIYIATVLKNNELLCAAHAHKALMLLPKLGQEEKRQLLNLLISLEENFKPESSELRDIIDMIKNQLSAPTSS
eukprot:Phypoly_transcript_09955.p1 GENE.Phypoly_transcript_09955~~Phypoly_transcript_09955.p1  ORF type:complete len:322 (+),score=65.06 Phypoly_transcript_09955:197-1162(+)